MTWSGHADSGIISLRGVVAWSSIFPRAAWPQAAPALLPTLGAYKAGGARAVVAFLLGGLSGAGFNSQWETWESSHVAGRMASDFCVNPE